MSQDSWSKPGSVHMPKYWIPDRTERLGGAWRSGQGLEGWAGSRGLVASVQDGFWLLMGAKS